MTAVPRSMDHANSTHRPRWAHRRRAVRRTVSNLNSAARLYVRFPDVTMRDVVRRLPAERGLSLPQSSSVENWTSRLSWAVRNEMFAKMAARPFPGRPRRNLRGVSQRMVRSTRTAAYRYRARWAVRGAARGSGPAAYVAGSDTSAGAGSAEGGARAESTAALAGPGMEGPASIARAAADAVARQAEAGRPEMKAAPPGGSRLVPFVPRRPPERDRYRPPSPGTRLTRFEPTPPSAGDGRTR